MRIEYSPNFVLQKVELFLEIQPTVVQRGARGAVVMMVAGARSLNISAFPVRRCTPFGVFCRRSTRPNLSSAITPAFWSTTAVTFCLVVFLFL